MILAWLQGTLAKHIMYHVLSSLFLWFICVHLDGGLGPQMELEKGAEVRRRAGRERRWPCFQFTPSLSTQGEGRKGLLPCHTTSELEANASKCRGSHDAPFLKTPQVPSPLHWNITKREGGWAKRGGVTLEDLKVWWKIPSDKKELQKNVDNSHWSGNLACCDVTRSPPPSVAQNFHDQCFLATLSCLWCQKGHRYFASVPPSKPTKSWLCPPPAQDPPPKGSTRALVLLHSLQMWHQNRVKGAELQEVTRGQPPSEAVTRAALKYQIKSSSCFCYSWISSLFLSCVTC